MEEKKLTDEEIVKALDCGCLAVVFGEHCEKCVLHDIESCNIVPDAIVALIHRLQSEIERLTEDRNKQRKLYVKEFAEHANHLGEFEKIKQQVVKDTAKEILQAVLEDVGEFYAGDIVEQLSKQYGVEVE